MSGINHECTRASYTDLERIRQTVDGGPYDAVLALAPENVPYYSGFYNIDLRLLPERLHVCIWPRGGDPAFVVVERRARLVRPDETYITDIRGYQGEGLDAMRVVSEVLADRGIIEGLIGYESRSFPAGQLLELMRLMPRLRFEDAYQFLEGPRVIKTPAEVELLTRVNWMTTNAIDSAFRSLRVGDTERSVMARMHAALIGNGADVVMAPLLAGGRRSGIWHGTAGDLRLEEGMILKTDFGGLLDGYYSDIARTAVIGRASSRQREIHAKITEIKHRVVAAIRPGMPAGDVARTAIKAYKDVGLEFKWHIIGHSIGLGVHEAPQIYPWVEEPILAGMTMMIEIGYSDYPNDSFHIEDLIHVTPGGAQYLTDASAHQEIWELGYD
ncbi:MAG: aminopeptidase P family protein [Candidatus Dormibacteraeota bacterium]|uniref:Aminopeptidase P family protein n=1 Tax=Candidatus Dormiibacter inghamiae TaxID=3127013 RepID=A0A934KAI1_9BACT|nr:aminopeptidase P family protein [Candidatus Dormibacteraeota bacterium]MBJ7605269.1 aminopeptidase P family protein [Candidatus Dormibacteraeota bacterium]